MSHFCDLHDHLVLTTIGWPRCVNNRESHDWTVHISAVFLAAENFLQPAGACGRGLYMRSCFTNICGGHIFYVCHSLQWPSQQHAQVTGNAHVP